MRGCRRPPRGAWHEPCLAPAPVGDGRSAAARSGQIDSALSRRFADARLRTYEASQVRTCSAWERSGLVRLVGPSRPQAPPRARGRTAGECVKEISGTKIPLIIF